MDGKMHYIDEYDEYTSKILCFPHYKCREKSIRVKKLESYGFDYLIEHGKKVLDINVLGKGFSSIVVLAHNKHYGVGALKVRRIDSRRQSLEREGIIMDYLEKTLKTPRLYMWNKDFIFMEYIDHSKCISVDIQIKTLISSNNAHKLKSILREIILSLYLIDKLGIDHGELNRPHDHMYICNNKWVKIIDWESSGYRKPRNLSQFMSYLMFRSDLKDLISWFLHIKPKHIINILKRYKDTYSIKYVIEILRLLEH